MNETALFEPFADLLAHPEVAARSHRQAGGKTVGFVGTGVPLELIEAAGMMPVELLPDPARGTEIGDRYMEDFFDGHIRSLFDRALRGEFAFVDLLVIPRTSEGYLQLYYYLQEAKRSEPDLRLPPIYLFDLLQTPFWITGRYVRGRVEDFAKTLVKYGGRDIVVDALSSAISDADRHRELLTRVNGLRRQAQPRVTGVQMWQIMRSAGLTDRASHCRMLKALLEAADQMPKAVGARVMVKGTQHDSDAFYRCVEALGALVVADDHPTSERSFEVQVGSDDSDPFEAVTRHYQRHTIGPRAYPQSEQDDRFLAIVNEAEVDGVIFHLEENDDTLGWDYPAQVQALSARSVPSLFLKFQPYRATDDAGLQEQLSAFVSSLACRTPAKEIDA